MKSQLAIATLTVAALTSCGSGSEGGAAIEPSTPTDVSTSLQPQPDTSDVDNASTTSDHTAASTAPTTSTGATTTTTSTTTATSTSSTAAPTTMSIPVEPALDVAQIDSCDLTFYGNSESEVSMILDGLKIGL